MSETNLMFPMLHMNGTSHQTLLEDYCNALMAVDNAMDALRLAQPHGRDYYVLDDPNAFNIASKQHLARLSALQTVRDELERIAEHVA